MPSPRTLRLRIHAQPPVRNAEGPGPPLPDTPNNATPTVLTMEKPGERPVEADVDRVDPGARRETLHSPASIKETF